MQRILLIINPTAGKSRSNFKKFHIADWFQKKGCNTTVHTTTKKGDAEAFAIKYSDANDIIVCCGGDGTLNEVISGVMQTTDKKPIGYLPSGTTNDMAKTLRLPKNSLQAARLILNESPVEQDIGAFNQTQYFTYIASFGAFTRVSYATPQWRKNLFGHLAYVVDGIKSVGDIHPYRVKVESEEFQEENDFIFGSVSNSSSIGGMLKFKSSDVCLNDGKFEVLLIRNPQNLLELRNIVYNLRSHKPDRNLVFFHTDKISFHFEKDTAWTVDGEYAGASNEVQIENLHNAVRLIRKQANLKK